MLATCLDDKVVWVKGLNIDLEVSMIGPWPGVSVHPADLETGLRTSFLYQMAYLLGEMGPRIRRCRGCQRLFLAGRTDKAFCSGLCQAKTYKREHPKTKSKKGVKRHGKKPSRRQSTQG